MQFGGELGRELMERDELVNLVTLPAVARAGRVELRNQLGNIAEDGGIQARPHDLVAATAGAGEGEWGATGDGEWRRGGEGGQGARA